MKKSKESKDHLDFDLEFLGKKETLRVPPTPESPKENDPNWRYYDPNNVNANSGKQYNWKNILIIGGITIFFGWTFFGSGNSSTSTSTSDNLATEGKYNCSQSNHDKAASLKPSDTEENRLENERTNLTRLKRELDNTYVDDSSQYSVNSYNKLVDSFNSKRLEYNKDLDSYNSRIQTYNNFLDANCTK